MLTLYVCVDERWQIAEHANPHNVTARAAASTLTPAVSHH